MYKAFIVYYFDHEKCTKLAECNSLESARRFVKKKSGGQECSYPWDGHSEGYKQYVIDRGNYI